MAWAYLMSLFALAVDKNKIKDIIPILNDPETAIIIGFKEELEREDREKRGRPKGPN